MDLSGPIIWQEATQPPAEEELLEEIENNVLSALDRRNILLMLDEN